MATLGEIIIGGDGVAGNTIGGAPDSEDLLISWTPTDPDPDEGGADSVNPLLNADGTCAIDPEWAEPRGYGVLGSPAVLAGGDRSGGGMQARRQHERGATRRVTLTWSAASGGDVERVRRAIQVTRGGAGKTRFRHPILDPAGPVSTAPWIRIAGGTVRLTRSPDGARAQMAVEVEYV